MNGVLRAYDVAKNARAETIARIVVTHEANGIAIWYAHRSADPRLLAWYTQTPRDNVAGRIAAAEVHARRLADDVINHGAQHAPSMRFEQR